MESLHIIWNPVAGGTSAETAFESISEILEQKGIAFSSAKSEYAGHAVLLAREAVVAGCRKVIAVGGDGTLGEIASELAGTDTVMGIIPAGTGNDLIRALCIPKDVSKALEIVLSGECRSMDMLEVNGRKCINVAGFGFDVDVLINMEKYKSRCKNGSVAYLRGLLDAIHDLKHRQTTIFTPGRTFERNAMVLAAGNGICIGGGMAVTPQADLFDGLLDVCVIHDVKKWVLPILLPKFMKGRHLGNKRVDYLKTTEVEAVCSPASGIQLDGEICETTPFRAKVLPGVLRIMVPGEREERLRKQHAER